MIAHPVVDISDVPVLPADYHADLHRFLAYWVEKRQGRRMPGRADIDPLEFSWILGRVSLVEVSPLEPRFRYRLLATKLAEHLGYEVTGRSTADMPEPETRAYVEEQYTRVTTTCAVHWDRGERVLDGRVWWAEAVYLPLSSDGRDVDMILVARIATPPKRKRPRLGFAPPTQS